MDNVGSSLFGETQDLVEITISQTKYKVPKGLELLRCYQFLEFEISAEAFCWNGECQNCGIDLAGRPGKTLSCQTSAQAGMKIEKLPTGVSAQKKEDL